MSTALVIQAQELALELSADRLEEFRIPVGSYVRRVKGVPVQVRQHQRGLTHRANRAMAHSRVAPIRRKGLERRRAKQRVALQRYRSERYRSDARGGMIRSSRKSPMDSTAAYVVTRSRLAHKRRLQDIRRKGEEAENERWKSRMLGKAAGQLSSEADRKAERARNDLHLIQLAVTSPRPVQSLVSMIIKRYGSMAAAHAEIPKLERIIDEQNRVRDAHRRSQRDHRDFS